MTDTVWTNRHPATQHFEPLFAYSHLPEGKLQEVSRLCHNVACTLLYELPDGPELNAGLRKLLEAKDCFVRAAMLEKAGVTCGF